jgi:hypothetical protein
MTVTTVQTVKKKIVQTQNHEWDSEQLREVWTKTFKSSAAAEDDVQEDDVEMTVEGGTSSEEWMKENPIPYIMASLMTSSVR